MNTASDTLAPLLKKLRLWAHFDPVEEQALLGLRHDPVSVGSHHKLVREGDVVSQCYLLLTGFCIRHKIVGDGGRQILSIHMAGDLVDLTNAFLGVADHGVDTLTSCELARIPLDVLRQLMNAQPKIKDALWYDTMVDGSIHREWIANVGRRDGRTRLAHLLCEFALKLEAVYPGDRLVFELPMTQEQLADATGLTPVHVNRMLMSLAKDGLIERVTPKSVVIGDWTKLAAAGDFDRGYLHLDAASRRTGTL